MKIIKTLFGVFFVSLFVLFPSLVGAQSTQEPGPQITLSGVVPEGKGVIIGTTFDLQVEGGFLVRYYVGGTFGDGCFETQGTLIGEIESSSPLVNQPITLDGVDLTSLAGKCIYARAFIFFFESEVGPSNQVQLHQENALEQPTTGSQGVLGASTTATTPQVKAAVLVETGNEFALVAIFVGLSIIMFTLSLHLSRP
jgi:hypothetical protein